jgi:hypothetical protein
MPPTRATQVPLTLEKALVEHQMQESEAAHDWQDVKVVLH